MATEAFRGDLNRDLTIARQFRMHCDWCGRSCSDALPCPRCEAVYYCCREHAKRYCHVLHRDACPRLKQHKQRVFPGALFCKESIPLKAPLWQAYLQTARVLTANTDQELWKGLWGLETRFVPCLESRVHPSATWSIGSWSNYCSVRGIDRESPVPVLMQYPLSVYHALLLKQHLFPDDGMALGKRITICYLGPEVELRILPVFWELGCLLGQFDLQMHFIGPEVQEEVYVTQLSPVRERCKDLQCSCHRTACSEPTHLEVDMVDGEKFVFSKKLPELAVETEHQTGVTIRTHRGLYHDTDLEMDQVSLVFASNAGIELYASWIPTLTKLSQNKVFTVLTDYTEEAIYRSVQFLKSLGQCPSFTFVNPFHNPLPSKRAGISVPCYSNGFGLILNGCSD